MVRVSHFDPAGIALTAFLTEQRTGGTRGLEGPGDWRDQGTGRTGRIRGLEGSGDWKDWKDQRTGGTVEIKGPEGLEVVTVSEITKKDKGTGM